MADTATYVYCIVHRSARPVVTRVPHGLAGASLPRLVDLDITRAPGSGGGGLWMVCADVPLGVYGAESIEEGLRDLKWVSRIAVAHEAVVERFTRVDGATVIPMKLFTIFANEARAEDEMRRRRRDLDGILKRIRGCQEWGVRVLRTQQRRSAGRVSPPASGAAFLAAKRQARDAARDQATQAARAADEVYRALGRVAKEVRRREPPEGAAAPPMLDAAFLVPAVRRARFKAAAAKAAVNCRAAGAEVVLTGPWPAYHFVETGDAA